MTDEATADKPLENLAAAERKPDPLVTDPRLQPSRFNPLQDAVDPPTKSAHVRLREFEDKMFGADCVRIRGGVERGYGSKFKEMTEPQAAHYAALEKLVVAEQTLADAHTALIDAENAAQAAADLADKTEAEIDGPASE